MMRAHQAQMQQVVDEIIAGAPVRKIICHVTPGGGKSALPIIAGKLVSAGLADALCWICPRSALQDQGERNFLDPFFRKMFGHRLAIRSSTNEPNPCRGQDGFITTYQALAVDNERTVQDEFMRRRYVLVLDEFHHIEQGGEWHAAIAPLVERARFAVLMTGTLERGNEKPIAFIDYENSMPVIDDTDEQRVIRYTRTDALRERAILPARFHLSDGHVEWENKAGRIQSGQLSCRTKDAGEALFTALSTGFADSLLEVSVTHWMERKKFNPRAKLLVVAANIEHARKALGALKQMGVYSKIATSHDSLEALRNIRAFKADLDCLVSIAMAYEGLDVPAISHIASLTHIRSTPWIEQMIARAVRVDRQAGPYRSQMAHVFAPDDFLFREVVDRIQREQLPIVAASGGDCLDSRGNGEGEGDAGPKIRPLNGEMTGTREIEFGGIPDGTLFEPVQTIKEQEEETLHRIEMHVRKFSFDNRYRPQRISAEIKTNFGKSRRHMTLDELRQCLAWVRRTYPISGRSSEFLPDGVSRTRGSRERVPTKAQPWTAWG